MSRGPLDLLFFYGYVIFVCFCFYLIYNFCFCSCGLLWISRRCLHSYSFSAPLWIENLVLCFFIRHLTPLLRFLHCGCHIPSRFCCLLHFHLCRRILSLKISYMQLTVGVLYLLLLRTCAVLSSCCALHIFLNVGWEITCLVQFCSDVVLLLWLSWA